MSTTAHVSPVFGVTARLTGQVKGSVNVDNDGGHANITFPISGPKGKATVEAVATRDAEKWVYTMLKVSPDGGPPIDLLQ